MLRGRRLTDRKAVDQFFDLTFAFVAEVADDVQTRGMTQRVANQGEVVIAWFEAMCFCKSHGLAGFIE